MTSLRRNVRLTRALAPLYTAIILCSVAFIGLPFDPEQRLALYFGVPFAAACMILYPVIARRRDARREASRLAEAGRH